MSSVDSKVRMLSHLIILWSMRETFKIEIRGGGGGGGEMDDNQRRFTHRGSALCSNPLSFYIHFLTEDVPLSYTLY